MKASRSSQFPTYDYENIKGFGRTLLLIGTLIFFGVYGSTRLSGVDPILLAKQYRETIWYFKFASEFLLTGIAAVANWTSLKYMIAPLGAIFFVIVVGAYYVKDIYNLPSFTDGLKYVLASMFAIRYPRLTIDKGAAQILKSQVNLIDRIGGPGFVILEPGNAAMFRKLRGPSGVSVSATYFLAPFERLAQAVNLDDQQGDKDQITATTRDGIQVALCDVHFRYRIQQDQRNGQTVRRSPEEPYPFSETALKSMVFNLQVQKDGLDKWNVAVERALTGSITDFIASHTIDYLTAPRANKYNPRIELKDELFYSSIRSSLSGLGAELLWVDVGHIEIVESIIDDQRSNLWAADWVGDAAVTRAYGVAKRQAYRELGRAEAQAEMILSIADAIASANASEYTPDNIRKILLARTAQILDAISDSKKEGEQE